MKISDTLSKAADILERDGWLQGAYYKEPEVVYAYPELDPAADEEARRTAPCCQRGAISRAVFGSAYVVSAYGSPVGYGSDFYAAFRYFDEYMMYERGVEGTVAWNDAPGRTKGEVVEALRGAAGKARGEGR